MTEIILKCLIIKLLFCFYHCSSFGYTLVNATKIDSANFIILFTKIKEKNNFEGIIILINITTVSLVLINCIFLIRDSKNYTHFQVYILHINLGFVFYCIYCILLKLAI